MRHVLFTEPEVIEAGAQARASDSALAKYDSRHRMRFCHAFDCLLFGYVCLLCGRNWLVRSS